MADKEANELFPKNRVNGADIIPTWDSQEGAAEKLKSVSITDIKLVKWNPNVPPATPGIVGIIQLACNLNDFNGTPLAFISAGDIITSVIDNTGSPFGGGPPYTYGLWFAGDQPTLPGGGQLDPYEAFLEFNCNQIGGQVLECGVMDSAGNWSYIEVFCIVQDNFQMCNQP